MFWDDFNFVTWCVILLEAAIRRLFYCGHTRIDIASNNIQVCFKRCSVGTVGPRVDQENYSDHYTSIRHQYKAGRFHAVYDTSVWLLQWRSRLGSGDIFPIFYHLILAIVQIIIWLARVAFCCRNPSASMVSVLGIWSCSSAYPSYYNQVMQLQCGLSFLTSSINNTQKIHWIVSFCKL